MVFAQDNDTIVASATAPGVAGIGIVRISGNNISTYINEIINDDLEPRKASYKSFYDSNKKVIDQGIVIYFPSPDSFTGEDVAEFHCHGGKIIMEMVIERCLELGARLARPGEFSERAFLNDKIDLIQAESISDLINASSKASARSALLSMQGVFSDLVNELIEEIINLRKFVEACIDFPAEDIDFLKDDDLTNGLNNCIKKINETIEQAQQGRVIQEGIRLAIVGKPNAGKSSLFNLFAGEDLAIVTDIPGTTRDLLKENVFIDGLPVYLTDSAGLRETIDPIESEGIRRVHSEIKFASIILYVIDVSAFNPDEDLKSIEKNVGKLVSKDCSIILVFNKTDLSGISIDQNMKSSYPSVNISVKNKTGIDNLKKLIIKVSGLNDLSENAFTARRRHVNELTNALRYLEMGKVQLTNAGAGELLAEDLKLAQNCLSGITGSYLADDLLGEIFSSFCIGK